MTLGEKIRCARKFCGLSQEQLAEKLCVSRSAIAKWETDKGLPDVENLRLLARLLGVSVDSLLEDGSEASSAVLREPCDPAAFGRGCQKVRKDRLMRQRFPGHRICTLLGRPELSGEERALDDTRGFLTPVPFGSPEYMKSIRSLDRDFYLVEQEDGQLFVTVTDTYLEIRPLPQPQMANSFRLDGWCFVRGNYLPDE